MLSNEFALVLIESSLEGVRELVEDDYGGDMRGVPYLLVLDADGKLVRRQQTDELEDAKNGRHDPAKIKQFLKKSAPPRDAEAILAAALATASSQGKRVFVHFGASWSDSEDSSHLLDDFLRRPDIRQILARGFVDVNIQVDRMTGSKGLLARYGGHENGLLWTAILGAQGKVIGRSQGPRGDIVFPGQPSEIDQFMNMIKSSTNALTPEDLKTVEAVLSSEVRKFLSGEGR